MKNYYCLAAALIAVVYSLHAEKEVSYLKADWNVRDHVPVKKLTVQSHRGAGILAPENTIEAFELGWKLRTVPEADLRTTKDGVIVAFHDANFSRVVKGVSEEMKTKGPQDLTFAELTKLDVGAWAGDKFEGRRISKMTEVFALMKGRPDRHLYLDIKTVDLKQLAAEVKEYRVEKQVALASTKYEIIREWKRLVPESDTLLWMGGLEQTLRKRFDDLRKTDFADVTQLQIHIHIREPLGGKESVAQQAAVPSDYREPFTLSRQFLIDAGKELRSRKILYQTLPYNTVDPRVYWTLMDLGVASFSTDFPDRAWKAIEDYYRQRKGSK